MDINENEEYKNLSVREIALKKGIQYPSNQELIMMILGQGTKKMKIEELSSEVLAVIETSKSEELVDNLMKIPGMGISKVMSIVSCIEFGRRRNLSKGILIEKPGDIIPYVKHYSLKQKEHFLVVTITGAKELMEIKVISVGSHNKTFLLVRDVFYEAVKDNASAVICIHNHPGGNPSPSYADIECTKKIMNAANVLGITLMDHIIITKDEYFSFMEHGILTDS